MKKQNLIDDHQTTVESIKNAVDAFVKERDWQQFHTPNKLSMAIAIEAAELMEEFRFMTSKQSIELVKAKKEKVAQEVADIVIATLSFCNLYGIDLTKSIENKLQQNAEKYPIEKAKGNNKKYTNFEEK